MFLYKFIYKLSFLYIIKNIKFGSGEKLFVLIIFIYFLFFFLFIFLLIYIRLVCLQCCLFFYKKCIFCFGNGNGVIIYFYFN